jgi:hypothetical protein
VISVQKLLDASRKTGKKFNDCVKKCPFFPDFGLFSAEKMEWHRITD